jgi:rare lipoprotein A (peptidoglycan hydrolase)
MTYARQLLVVFGIAGALLSLLLPGCTRLIGREETPPPPPVVTPQAKEATPKPEGPKVEQVGEASWYGPAQNGKETASGDTFDQNKLTAAHPTLPLGTQAVVTNLETGKSVAVTINDRGPSRKGRKIDLSRAAAQKIGMTKEGVAQVKIESKPGQKPTKKVTRRKTKSRVTPVATRTDTPTLPPQ